MARDTLSGPFDFAPMTDYRNTFWRRSAQGDRLENIDIISGHAEGGCATRFLPNHKSNLAEIGAEKVNGFWVFVCQDVLFSERASPENPIDCRIFFADNPQRKTESGIGGKNP